MNIIARFFGVAIYFLLLIIFCLLIEKRRLKLKKYLFIYTIFLSIIAFFFKPSSGNDLYRIFDLMHIYSSENITEFASRITNSTQPLAMIYYRIIGKIGIDGLLPAITSFIYYRNIFYVFNDYANKTNSSNKAIAITLLIVMCNSSYFEVISGIRNMLAFSILIRCFYDEIYNKKRFIYNFPFYLMAIGIHSTAIIIFGIRILYFIVGHVRKKILKNAIVVLLCIIVVIIALYYAKDYIKTILDLSKLYIIEGKYDYFWENLLTIMIFMLVVYIQSCLRKLKCDEIEDINDLMKNRRYSLIFQIIIITFSFEHNIFFRFNNFNLLLNIPIIMIVIDNIIKIKKNNHKIIVMYTLIILMLSCIRGNLCSLKFWGG